MKINLRKLNTVGAAHLLLPLLIIVGAGIIGSFVAVRSVSHADIASSANIVPYTGNNDGCGGNATHYDSKKLKTHVGQNHYGKKSVCLCNNGHKVTYKKAYQNMTPNPACDKATKSKSNGASSNSGSSTKIKTSRSECSNGKWSTVGLAGTNTYHRCVNGKMQLRYCASGKMAVAETSQTGPCKNIPKQKKTAPGSTPNTNHYSNSVPRAS